MTRRRSWSDITVTDQFCGAGGSSIGAFKAGLRIRLAMNHWKLAVETHNTNFPDTDHDCCDISASDPRRYPSTDILITSPECTTHSPAGGNRKQRKDYGQRDIFMPTADDPAAERSRATMRDVPRFAEYHRYRRIIVENVVEVATRWGPGGALFHHWLKEMEIIGYRWKLVSANSMFSWPTPQSRDRLYVILWLKGDRAPDMEFSPPAPCGDCEKVVNAVQTWKPRALARSLNGQPFGKYRTQYTYSCPLCHATVVPFYFAALNAIDFSIPATRIGDRRDLGMPALKARTLDRIRYGLEKYGSRALVVNVKQGERDSSRAWPADSRPIGSIPTWDGYFGVAHPFIVRCANIGSDRRRIDGVTDPLSAVHAGGGNHALVHQSFLVETAHTHANAGRPRSLDEAMATMSGQQTSALVSPFVFNVGGRDAMASTDQPMPTQETRDKFALLTPFVVTLRTNNSGNPVDGALPGVCADGNHHAVIQGAAQISLRDANAMRVAGLDAELMTQGCAPQQGLVSRAPFITSYYGNAQASAGDEPIDTVTVRDRHALVQPQSELRVEDCYFRMLQPHEIGAAMAFPSSYTVLGNKRERVKQYGNAVTPPVMKMLIERQVAAMTGAEVSA